ncbi:hypothetical protein CDAR_427871 [Caerostris darwini]|uniref:Uncharacterized protein n=1 Tax=Caerostris darwini TaxID=1538125 RepID=A0AAV4QBS5_9ARAC|nr:hypothetical protein CDAR_427871 [Caerostris darwini]
MFRTSTHNHVLGHTRASLRNPEKYFYGIFQGAHIQMDFPLFLVKPMTLINTGSPRATKSCLQTDLLLRGLLSEHSFTTEGAFRNSGIHTFHIHHRSQW